MSYIRIIAQPDGHRKARSKRGWTEPTPKQLAKAAAAKQEADRKAAKEAARQAKAAKHQEWLKQHPEEQPSGE